MTSDNDIFDRLMSLKLFKAFNPFYKAHKEVLLYVFFGGLTTVISILSFVILYNALGVNEHIANIVSWVVAVFFAFITNRAWVFKSANANCTPFLKQMMRFYLGRILTLGIEEIIILIFISSLGFNAFLVKLFAQIVVLILNYVVSKLFVFAVSQNAKR